MKMLDSRGRTPVRRLAGGALSPLVVLFASLAAVLGAGCSDARPTAAVTAVDSAGVTILTSNGAGWEPADAWRLELDLEVGAVNGPDAFGRIGDVAPRLGGGIWVLDQQALRVRGYDETGTEVLSFGREGDGPGEFKSVDRVSQRPDGELSVGGPFPPTLYRFGADGEPLATELVPVADLREPPGEAETHASASRPPVGPTMGIWRFAADGSAFLQIMSMDVSGGEFVRSDVVLRPASPEAPVVRFASWESEMTSGGVGGTMTLLTPTASWSPLADGGIWFTPGDAYELRRYDAAGDVRRILRRQVPRVAVSDELEASMRAALIEEARAGSMRAMVERAEFADSFPATMNLWAAGPEEALWVAVVDPDLGGDLRRPNAWDIFAPDGRYVGRLPFPPGLQPTRVTVDHVYGVWLNELEVPFARRYRIVRNE